MWQLTKKNTNLNLILYIFICSISLTFIGCNEPADTSLSDSERQIEQLNNELQQAQLLLKQKDQQIANLQKLPDDYIEYVTRACKINLGRYTRVEDADNDLKVDSLVLYLHIMDKSGDKVKIAGSCEIELWDLDAPEDKNLVKSWSFSTDEFEENWDGILASEYRFTLPVDQYRPAKNNLTVKCRFTELLSGKSWEKQKMMTLGK